MCRGAKGQTFKPAEDPPFFPAVKRKEGAGVGEEGESYQEWPRSIALNSIMYVRTMTLIIGKYVFLKRMPSLGGPRPPESPTDAERSQSIKSLCKEKTPPAPQGQECPGVRCRRKGKGPDSQGRAGLSRADPQGWGAGESSLLLMPPGMFFFSTAFLREFAHTKNIWWLTTKRISDL